MFARKRTGLRAINIANSCARPEDAWGCGTTPVIVLMPIHPRVLRVMTEHDMGGERRRLRDYLAALSETHSIKVLDFTAIKSFHGRADRFYDGVHITRRNTNRVIVAIRGQAGEFLR